MKSNKRAQQIVLAAAVFDHEGRILVTHDGWLPTRKVTYEWIEQVCPLYLRCSDSNWHDLSPRTTYLVRLILPFSGCLGQAVTGKDLITSFQK